MYAWTYVIVLVCTFFIILFFEISLNAQRDSKVVWCLLMTFILYVGCNKFFSLHFVSIVVDTTFTSFIYPFSFIKPIFLCDYSSFVCNVILCVRVVSVKLIFFICYMHEFIEWFPLKRQTICSNKLFDCLHVASSQLGVVNDRKMLERNNRSKPKNPIVKCLQKKKIYLAHFYYQSIYRLQSQLEFVRLFEQFHVQFEAVRFFFHTVSSSLLCSEYTNIVNMEIGNNHNSIYMWRSRHI